MKRRDSTGLADVSLIFWRTSAQSWMSEFKSWPRPLLFPLSEFCLNINPWIENNESEKNIFSLFRFS